MLQRGPTSRCVALSAFAFHFVNNKRNRARVLYSLTHDSCARVMDAPGLVSTSQPAASAGEGVSQCPFGWASLPAEGRPRGLRPGLGVLEPREASGARWSLRTLSSCARLTFKRSCRRPEPLSPSRRYRISGPFLNLAFLD